MGETKLRLLIQAIELLSAVKGKLLAVVNRLAASPEMELFHGEYAGHDIDAVITTRELVKMIRSAHISPGTAGATWTTTVLFLSAIALHTFSVSSRSLRAPTG